MLLVRSILGLSFFALAACGPRDEARDPATATIGEAQALQDAGAMLEGLEEPLTEPGVDVPDLPAPHRGTNLPE